MSLRNWIILGGLSVAAACGTVKGDDTSGDDGPELDTTPPKLMSSTPADLATKVGVLSKLTFVFDEALAPETVTEASIGVTYIQTGYPASIKGTVTYDDASHTATFTPALPLVRGIQYAVHVAGTVTDAAGNAFSGADQTFLTTVNYETKSIYYNSNTGQVAQWYGYELDANGRLNKYLYYSATGPDGNWFTVDDVIGGHYEYTYLANGQPADERYFGVGPDGLWNTADDVIQSFYRYTYDTSGRQLERTRSDAPGPDAMWGTADDPVALLSTYVYTGNVTRQTSFSNPGVDTIWRTADDRASSYYESTYNQQGLRTKQVRYLTGADQIPKTGDDTVSYYYDFAYNATYSLTLQVQRTAGLDTTWFTADDGYGYVGKQEYDTKGAMINYLAYSSPGPDTIWLTADDPIGSRTSYTADANGLMTADFSYSGPGPDAVWNTADDAIASYTIYTYDAAGNRMDYKNYQSPGPDNVWRTNDDRLSYRSDYDLSH